MLSKIEELCYIAKSTNAAVIGIFETELDASELQQKISLDNYKTLLCDRNRHREGVACYIRNDRSYNILSAFPVQLKTFSLKFYHLTEKATLTSICI